MDRVLAGGTEAKPARILFVDDEPRVRAAFARVMEAEGFHVDLAANGAEALRLAELHTYPVVATDLAMPEMDGISLIRQLHLKDAATVFVIVTSASVVQVPTDAQLRDHVSSIVTKPFAVQELVETLNRSIHLWESRSSRRSPASEAPADSILLIEDDDADAELVSSFLRCTRHRGKVVRVRRLNEAIQALEEDRFGVILTDLSLPDARGLDVVLRIQNTTTDTPLIVLSGQSANGVAVQALQAGAQDYLIKGGVDGAALVRSIQYARERKRSEQELAQLAHFDPLTGLANRAQFKQRLDSTFARARRMQEPFAVLFLDLDGFKPINDDYGHAAGDALLVEVSRRLEETLREYDIVARLGGDEFAIVLDKLADQNEAELIARRMLKVIAKPHRLDDIEVRVTASIGIAMHPEDGATASDLVKSADHAMYSAKRLGRNTFATSTPSAPRETSGVRTSARLREMFSKDKLLLEYSPCFDAAQGNIVVAEGRLTWRPAAAPSTTPREFFRTLDDAQENDQLSEWVVNTACGDLLRLRAASPTIRRVSVHVSAQQLLARGFVRTVLQGLEETGVTPSCLELSLTDEAVTRRPDQALLVMRELKKHGVRLSMVEFGASCSSLFHLSLVPLDTIKVHPRFVRELSSNTHYQFVLAGIVAMAKEMGVAVHAGGIETSVQYDFLTSTGCDLIQGPMVDERMSCGLWAQPTGTLCA